MRKIIAFVLAALFAVGGSAFRIKRSEAASIKFEDARKVSMGNNEDGWNYADFFHPITSYLFENDDGTITSLEYTDGITVKLHDADFNFISSKSIECELPIFGGFYAGNEYNFLFFGQENYWESDDSEVIRVVRYTKDWQRIGDASLYGANTHTPFVFGVLRAEEYNGHLFVHTCHTMYADSNGACHQANLSFILDVSSMQITDSGYEVAYENYCYVSHSLNQFVKIDGDSLLFLDQGDCYPRTARLFRYPGTAGATTLHLMPESIDLFVFPGEDGDCCTGSSFGGFETTSFGYMTAGNMNFDDIHNGKRNIFVTVVNREDFSPNGISTTMLTDYDDASNITVSTPQLVKISDNKLLVMWTESSLSEKIMKLAFVDAMGNLISEVTEAPNFRSSDCMPIVIGDNVVWFVTYGSTSLFFFVNIAGSEPIPVPIPDDAPVVPLDYALNIPGGKLAFSTSPTFPFCSERDEDRLVAASYESANSWAFINTRVYVEEGDRLLFDYNLGSNGDWTFALFIDDAGFYCGTQNAGWQELSYTFTAAGEHSLTWYYYGSDNEGSFCKIDNIRIDRISEPEPSPTPFILGDADSNGIVNFSDALLVMRYSLGGSAETLDFAAADVDCNGSVTIIDAVTILRYSMNVIDTF